LQPQNDKENIMRRHPTSRAANQPMANRQAPIKRPEKLPLLDAICKKLNQRVNLDDEQRVRAGLDFQRRTQQSGRRRSPICPGSCDPLQLLDCPPGSLIRLAVTTAGWTGQ
jgi:hypothetical protein